MDPTALNPELGTQEDYGRLVEALHARGMGQLLDIVPNHAGIGSDNDRWLDVLENGLASPYARFFDIDWCRRTELSGKVLLSVLGDHYRAVLEDCELELSFDAQEGSFSVNYYEHRFPLDPKRAHRRKGAVGVRDGEPLLPASDLLRSLPVALLKIGG